MKGARFKIVGLTGLYGIPKDLYVNGKKKYCRIMIQRLKEGEKIEVKKTLMDYGKKFLIIGNMNAITYKEVFPYIKNNEIWLGVSTFNQGMYFIVDDDFEYAKSYKFDKERNGQRVSRVASICWFTNLDHNKRHQSLDLYKHYTPEEFPHYDNYDAIEVSKVCDIPLDYEGVMGVPITFLDKYCPSQFEIVDAREVALYDKQRSKSTYLIKDADGTINGKPTYARICIKRVSK